MRNLENWGELLHTVFCTQSQLPCWDLFSELLIKMSVCPTNFQSMIAGMFILKNNSKFLSDSNISLKHNEESVKQVTHFEP